jgi:hypothetical protein
MSVKTQGITESFGHILTPVPHNKKEKMSIATCVRKYLNCYN